MKFSVIIAGLFSAMVVKAAVYEINFATNADALDCQTRDIKYINKVSDSHEVNGTQLTLTNAKDCNPVILEQFDAVCPALVSRSCA
ncbi:hypothetical protein HMPREF1544_07152 [Mucor circinelloides 1006PhL]|uniref:Uncharacterized protein n=1 Tax=Mucor circinelloides f. circinelloides (strain 1006PhL) TaxID=1220926 RepID=S2J7G2_MUCC1|nr:hypothetical protein HMPREF1544_07152 [Mucor circinelloides 1006PhL]KAG1086513.1 hypothetical protein G6F42_020958 [Rhizopus arrhizus]